jgi:multicomponent Na+:H+ antiporter subunit C
MNAEFWERLLINYPYVTAALLFAIGTYTVLSHNNMMKKIIGINIVTSAIFLLFIAAGHIKGYKVPITDMADKAAKYANPVPTALILTGIVVSVSVTAFALSLLVKLYRYYGTIDACKIVLLRSAQNGHDRDAT